MMAAVIIGTILVIPLLVLITFVQLLYLESMRLRTRDLPSLKYSRKHGRPPRNEDRGRHGDVLNHQAYAAGDRRSVVPGWSADGSPWSIATFWEGALSAWMVMLGASYGVPQLLYRRTSARWLLGWVPLFRAVALIAPPWVALLDFFFPSRWSNSPMTPASPKRSRHPLRTSRRSSPRHGRRPHSRE